MVGSRGTSSLQCMLVLGVHTGVASVVPSVKSPFPVNSQQLIPVFGCTKAPGLALTGFQQKRVTNLHTQSCPCLSGLGCRVPKSGCIFPLASWQQEQLKVGLSSEQADLVLSEEPRAQGCCTSLVWTSALSVS